MGVSGKWPELFPFPQPVYGNIMGEGSVLTEQEKIQEVRE